MEASKVQEKFPRIEIKKISNGFLVSIIPENKELQKLLQDYTKNIISQIQNIGDGEEWKEKMTENISKALKGAGNDNVKIYACKNEFEVMGIIAPRPEGETLKGGNPDLSWFWDEEGHISN